MPPVRFFSEQYTTGFVLGGARCSVRTQRSNPRDLVITLGKARIIIAFSERTSGSVLTSVLKNQGFGVFNQRRTTNLLLSMGKSDFLLRGRGSPAMMHAPDPKGLVQCLIRSKRLISSNATVTRVRIVGVCVALGISGTKGVGPAQSSNDTLRTKSVVTGVSLLSPAGIRLTGRGRTNFPLVGARRSLRRSLTRGCRTLRGLL